MVPPLYIFGISTMFVVSTLMKLSDDGLFSNVFTDKIEFALTTHEIDSLLFDVVKFLLQVRGVISACYLRQK